MNVGQLRIGSIVYIPTLDEIKEAEVVGLSANEDDTVSVKIKADSVLYSGTIYNVKKTAFDFSDETGKMFFISKKHAKKCQVRMLIKAIENLHEKQMRIQQQIQEYNKKLSQKVLSLI